MSYYQGDFYQGDFYQGDPFFGSLFARLGRGVVSGVKGAIGFGGGVRPGIGARAGSMIKIGAERVGTIVSKHPVLSAAGAAGTIGILGGMGGERLISGGAMAAGRKGFHMSKARRGVPSHLVRNRHMRVTNPRALRRALRRAHGFARLAMRTIHLIHPKKKARFGGFRKKARAR